MANKRLSRADWVNAATQVLATSGIDMVRVDNLAKKLKITRGSFYYHFDSRKELLQAVLDSWRLKATEAVIESLKMRSSDSKEQLLELIALPLKGDKAQKAASIEISLRAWARRDEIARATVDEVDSYRISFIEDLFKDMGHSPQQAKDLAHLMYSFLIASSLVEPEASEDVRRERAQRIANFLADNCPLSECKFRGQA
ncbi:TetR/AcrR family transcriptional regulator [Marinobacterium sediminicola]|nr:TetR/AcrR family transcriptional regulator [Marinobacterium sediminicola]ULG70083.1 TetR/AcrR family transcriptional regulator [Marinobacterium sediminicola]